MTDSLQNLCCEEKTREMFFKFTKEKTTDVRKDKENDEEFIDFDNMNWFTWIYHLIKMSPSDLLLFYNEKLELIDWDKKTRTVAQPLGNGLTILTYVIRFIQDNLIKPNYINIYDAYTVETLFDFTKSDTLRKYNLLPQASDVNNDYNIKNSDKTGNQFYIKLDKHKSNNNWYYNSLKCLDYCLFSLLVFIVIINIIISVQFLSGYYRYYSLLYTSKVPTDSPDILRKPSEALINNDNKSLSKRTPLNIVKTCIIKMLNRKGRIKKSTDSKSDEDYYYEIRKWDPTKFITNLFMTFSPIPLIFVLLSTVSFSTLLAILIHQYLFQLILDKYQNRIRADTVLFSAILEEYYIKSVKPMVSKKYQDAQIDATPNGHDFIAFYPSAVFKKNDIFKTHTFTGELIRERYNIHTKEFEKFENNTKGHNVVMHNSSNLSNVY